jgi:hypothetical protein
MANQIVLLCTVPEPGLSPEGLVAFSRRVTSELRLLFGVGQELVSVQATETAAAQSFATSGTPDTIDDTAPPVVFS